MRIDYEVGDTITLQQARELMPPGKVYSLVKDTTVHMRWQVKFKNPDGAPIYFSKGWGPKSSNLVRSALRHVLTEAWAHHSERTGNECPLQFQLGV